MSQVTPEHINQILTAISNLEVKFEKRMDGLEKRLDVLESRMAMLAKRMEALESRMAMLAKRMDSLESRMNEIEANQKSLQRLLFDHIDATSHMELEFRNRFLQIDNRFEEITDELTVMNENLEYVNSRIGNNEVNLNILIKKSDKTYEIIRNHDLRLQKLESHHGSP